MDFIDIKTIEELLFKISMVREEDIVSDNIISELFRRKDPPAQKEFEEILNNNLRKLIISSINDDLEGDEDRKPKTFIESKNLMQSIPSLTLLTNLIDSKLKNDPEKYYGYMPMINNYLTLDLWQRLLKDISEGETQTGAEEDNELSQKLYFS